MSSMCGKVVYSVVGYIVFTCEKVLFFALSLRTIGHVHEYNSGLSSSYPFVFNMGFTQQLNMFSPLLNDWFFAVSTPPITNSVY